MKIFSRATIALLLLTGAAHAGGDDAYNNAKVSLFAKSTNAGDTPVKVTSQGYIGMDLRTIAGVALDTNSGNKSAGTLRVVVATDQPAIPVTGTFWQATQPVSGTFWQATQPTSVADGSNTTFGAKADAKSTATDTTAVSAMSVLKQISASVQAPPSQAVTNAGTFATQATLQAGSAVAGKFGIDQTTPGTTNGVQVNAALPAGTNVIGHVVNDASSAVIGHVVNDASSAVIGHVIDDSGSTTAVTGNVTVVGPAASGASASGNPVELAGVAETSESVVTAGQAAALVTDLAKKLIVLPYANPENFVSGGTAAMTGTTSTSTVAAPAAGLRNYITNITCTNSHATVGTFVLVQDGSAGTTLYEAYAAPAGGGFSIPLPTPLRQPTTATAIFTQDVTTGANVICFASGYKGA